LCHFTSADACRADLLIHCLPRRKIGRQQGRSLTCSRGDGKLDWLDRRWRQRGRTQTRISPAVVRYSRNQPLSHVPQQTLLVAPSQQPRIVRVARPARDSLTGVGLKAKVEVLKEAQLSILALPSALPSLQEASEIARAYSRQGTSIGLTHPTAPTLVSIFTLTRVQDNGAWCAQEMPDARKRIISPCTNRHASHTSCAASSRA
jgi:hypothetical protein